MEGKLMDYLYDDRIWVAAFLIVVVWVWYENKQVHRANSENIDDCYENRDSLRIQYQTAKTLEEIRKQLEAISYVLVFVIVGYIWVNYG